MHPLRSKFLQYFTHIYLLLIFHLFVWLYPVLFLNHRRIITRFNFTIYFIEHLFIINLHFFFRNHKFPFITQLPMIPRSYFTILSHKYIIRLLFIITLHFLFESPFPSLLPPSQKPKIQMYHNPQPTFLYIYIPMYTFYISHIHCYASKYQYL